MNSRPTQCERVKQYMNDFGSITQFDAMRDLGVMRLASRISEMRKKGVAICSRMETGKNRYGEKITYKRYFFEEVQE